MGLIVNPRGIAGSGKTELVRHILAAFGQSPEALARSNPPDGPRQLVHRLPHPAGGRPLALIGAYGGRHAGSGVDGVRAQEGGLIEAIRLAGQAAEEGDDVLLEGLALSWDHTLSAALAGVHPLHVIKLATPREASVANLLARRRSGRAALGRALTSAAAQEQALDKALARLAPVAQVRTLGFEDALRHILALLRLNPPLAAAA